MTRFSPPGQVASPTRGRGAGTKPGRVRAACEHRVSRFPDRPSTGGPGQRHLTLSADEQKSVRQIRGRRLPGAYRKAKSTSESPRVLRAGSSMLRRFTVLPPPFDQPNAPDRPTAGGRFRLDHAEVGGSPGPKKPPPSRHEESILFLLPACDSRREIRVEAEWPTMAVTSAALRARRSIHPARWPIFDRNRRRLSPRVRQRFTERIHITPGQCPISLVVAFCVKGSLHLASHRFVRRPDCPLQDRRARSAAT
jgi:hypothetical protein